MTKFVMITLVPLMTTDYPLYTDTQYNENMCYDNIGSFNDNRLPSLYWHNTMTKFVISGSLDDYS